MAKTSMTPKSKSTKDHRPKSAGLKDPQGGLTAAGRAAYQKSEGAHLRPGVKGPADTPEKMKRKGSFLRRHFANPRGPMVDEHGRPTRLALSAHAWGEPVPKTMEAAQKLADKGTRLLKKYKASRSAETVAPKKKNSLVANINKRKAAGTSRPKAKSTVSKKAYEDMQKGWPDK